MNLVCQNLYLWCSVTAYHYHFSTCALIENTENMSIYSQNTLELSDMN
jgi:hypothetical protein